MPKLSIKHIFFGLSMLLYIGFPIYLVAKYEALIGEGVVYRFHPEPVDPFDPFRGRYVSINYAEDRMDYPEAEAAWQKGQTVYLVPAQKADGFTEWQEVLYTQPSHSNYLETTVRRVNDEAVFFNLPFEEYFVNEKAAPQIEQFFRDREEAELAANLYAEVFIKDGKAILRDIYFYGETLETYLKNHPQAVETE
ncbi:MAG: GDYXXLXY domain-containing protein [Bacteroidota bacterium]